MKLCRIITLAICIVQPSSAFVVPNKSFRHAMGITATGSDQYKKPSANTVTQTFSAPRTDTSTYKPDDLEFDSDKNFSPRTDVATPLLLTRRTLLTSFAACTALFSLQPPEAEAAFPSSLFNSKYSLSIVKNTNSTNAASIRQPLKEGLGSPLFSKELATESCLLKLLPVKRTVFRKLEKDLVNVSILRSYQQEDQGPTEKAYMDVYDDMKNTLAYFDSQRGSLEPVFNQDDSTGMTMSKAIQGEGRIEALRTEICNIMNATKNMEEENVYLYQKRALRALSVVGEFLVDRFPYDVPQEGRFSYLPRLLGRAEVIFTVSRPKKKGSDKVEVIGNVTIVADGYAAPITAGNFVDLATRNFYTGLPVKIMKKRLGATTSLTTSDDNVVAYDIASTVDKITGEDGVVQKTFGTLKKKMDATSTPESEDNAIPGTILTAMPILGAFNEGFYDPLTAKPRRIPLEIVQFDGLSLTAKLSYESGFTSSSPKKAPVSKLLPSVKNSPLLTYDIPGLVGMNHPDKNLNGASSELFSLRKSDMSSERTTLLDGQYAPFGYVMEGSSIMDNLQAGDIISATYVNEWGQMNLKKIRGSSFADALNQDNFEDD